MGNDGGKRSVWRGVISGMAGGVVGSLALKAAMVALRTARTGTLDTQFDQSGPAHQVAERAMRTMGGRALTRGERVVAGEVVHYAFGAVTGGFYGGLAERWEWVRLGGGMLFGLGVFAAADETSMPALGLVVWPQSERVEGQVEHLLVHLVFGVSTEAVRRAIRAGLDG